MSVNVGNKNYNDWDGALINIQVNANTNILCKSYPGADVNKAVWQISEVVQSTDSLFGGVLYSRTFWAVYPNDGEVPELRGTVSSDFNLKASDALSLSFL